MAYVLAYLGTLAFVAFALWLRSDREATRTVREAYTSARLAEALSKGNDAEVTQLVARVVSIEQALASPPTPPDLADIRETVSALAMRAGLRNGRG